MSEWAKYDGFSVYFFLDVIENILNVVDRHHFSHKTGTGHRLVVNDAQMHHQYIMYLKFSYFNEDNYAGAGSDFCLKFEITDDWVQDLSL